MLNQVLLFNQLSPAAQQHAIESARKTDYGANWRDEPMADMKATLERLGFSELKIYCSQTFYCYGDEADITGRFSNAQLTQQNIDDANDFFCAQTAELFAKLPTVAITADIVNSKVKDLEIQPLSDQLIAIRKKLDDALADEGDYFNAPASKDEIKQLERQETEIFKAYCKVRDQAMDALQNILNAFKAQIFYNMHDIWERTFSDDEISEYLINTEQKFDALGNYYVEDYADCFC